MNSELLILLVSLAVIVGLFAVVIFGGSITASLSGLKIDTPGAIKAINAALREKQKPPLKDNSEVKNQIDSVEEAKEPPLGPIVWVDDHPENNKHELKALKKLGVHCFCLKKNQDAIKIINKKQPKVILSDVGRDSGVENGFDLLVKVREMGIKTPFAFYTWRANDKTREQAVEKETDIFEYPDELIGFVLNHLLDL